jgi:hypothetical protein
VSAKSAEEVTDFLRTHGTRRAELTEKLEAARTDLGKEIARFRSLVEKRVA